MTRHKDGRHCRTSTRGLSRVRVRLIIAAYPAGGRTKAPGGPRAILENTTARLIRKAANGYQATVRMPDPLRPFQQ
jgi:hypothetical protein